MRFNRSKECWSSLLGKEYNALQEYCGGIASSVMPATSSVESDYFLINWTRDCSTFKVNNRVDYGLKRGVLRLVKIDD